MKTPREVLLHRHAAAGPMLDAIRREAVEEVNCPETKEQSSRTSFVSLFLCCFHKLWGELVWPVRRVWAGLAVTWLVLALINTQLREPKVTTNAVVASAPSQGGITLAEQRRWLAELIPGGDAPISGPPRRFVPRPRSEVLFQTITV